MILMHLDKGLTTLLDVADRALEWWMYRHPVQRRFDLVVPMYARVQTWRAKTWQRRMLRARSLEDLKLPVITVELVGTQSAAEGTLIDMERCPQCLGVLDTDCTKMQRDVCRSCGTVFQPAAQHPQWSRSPKAWFRTG